MFPFYLHCVRVLLYGMVVLPAVLFVCSSTISNDSFPTGFFLISVLVIIIPVTIVKIAGRRFSQIKEFAQQISNGQTEFFINMAARKVPFALITVAGLGLFLELSLIRWHSAIFPFLSFYKNFTLLTCFSGLGLGYALADRKHIPLLFSIVLLTLQVVFFIFLRYGLHPIGIPFSIPIEIITASPVHEMADIGYSPATGLPHYLSIFLFLGFTFLITCLTMLPLGQLSGVLLVKCPPLKGYGCILAGSIAGVLLSMAIGYLWTPPAVWFGIAGIGILIYFHDDRRVWLPGSISTIILTGVLMWPVHFPWTPVYSPYQFLEFGPGEGSGFSVRAEGHFFQNAHDLSAGTEQQDLKQFYDLPFNVAKTRDRVIIIGAGTGNDVAAALRADVSSVVAVEVDPAIYQLGVYYHPEAPYADPRVKMIIDDARSVLARETGLYDIVLYGLLDSHVLLNSGANLRIDSYVYTMEGLEAAKRCLKPDGIIALSFIGMSDDLTYKLFQMLQYTFGEGTPVILRAETDGSLLFMVQNNGFLDIDPHILVEAGFKNITSSYMTTIKPVDLPTDDWPFFFMTGRSIPMSYLIIYGLMIAGTAYLAKKFDLGFRKKGGGAFFLLGAGFMLLETKAIAELSLQFGNTWQVVGVTVICILFLSFLANLFISKVNIDRLIWPGIALLMSLMVGLIYAGSSTDDFSWPGKMMALLVVTGPICFSGLIFSMLLKKTGTTHHAMSMNLLGALTGGLLEYFSLAIGFQGLYWLAVCIYAVAVIGARPFSLNPIK